MDRLKKARKPIRSSFSKTANEITTELAKEEPDLDSLIVKLCKLEQLQRDIADLDDKVLTVMLDADCTEEEYAAEHGIIEEYQDKCRISKFQVDKALNKAGQKDSDTMSSHHSDESTHTNRPDHGKKYKLPKIEIKKFDGNLKEWLSFWSQFEKIHEDKALHASDKFQYLVQSIVSGTRARELVDSYPQTAENYPKVINALQERFGNSKLLVQVYVRELLKMVITNNSVSRERIQMSRMYDQLESHLRALESLKIPNEQLATFLYPMVESSLPEEMLIAWQRSPLNGCDGSRETPPKSELDFLMQFLRKEVENEDQRNLVQSGFTSLNISDVSKKKHTGQEKQYQKSHEMATAAGLYVGTSKNCVFCDKAHVSQECGKAVMWTQAEKQDKVKAKKACFICLQAGHGAKTCKSYVKCTVCLKKHYAIMCPELMSKRNSSEKKIGSKNSNEQDHVETTHSQLCCTSDVLLQTLIVTVCNSETNKQKRVRALCDPGAQRSYILQKTAKEIELLPTQDIQLRHMLFGGSSEVQRHKAYTVKLSNLNDQYSQYFDVLDQKQICGTLPRMDKGRWLEELSQLNIYVADLGSVSPEIEILIGSDYYPQLLTGKKYTLKNGLIALETRLGWTLTGKLRQSLNESDMLAATITDMFVGNATVSDLWSLDTIGIHDPVNRLTQEDREKEVMKHFIETVNRLEDGRYSVSLPWVEGAQKIPDNKSVAEQRLLSTTRKLKSINGLEEYDRVFSCWLKEGFIEEVTSDDTNKQVHYLPHRAVYKPGSTTTPIRPVFDASCKTGRNPSLNECLEKGPNLLELIPTILLRFREDKIGVIADIKKAFQMIEIREKDRDFLRFLWWEDEAHSVQKIFRHKRVVFGVNSSPFQLAAVIKYHLTLMQGVDQQVSAKLMNSFYVDNCVTSVNSMTEYEHFKTKATALMAEAKMELCQWECSHEEPFICGNREFFAEGNSSRKHTTYVLGYKWDKVADTISCSFSEDDIPEKITKRTILSYTQKIFDPIGFLCPVLLCPKLLLQEAWIAKINWDEELSGEIRGRFVAWCKEFRLLSEICIPRNFSGGVSSRDSYQMHTFCDASKSAYAAVIYLRAVDAQGRVSVQLLQAKSRVAPVKQVTIPRLELLACTIAARLTNSVKKSLAMERMPTHYWSDSSTALSWIKGNDEWGTFVGNRVKEICSLSNPQDWRHVAGINNPADLPSRGCSTQELARSRWWEGPEWLRERPECWPSEQVVADNDAVSKEKKKTNVVSMIATSLEPAWFVRRYSSYVKNIRSVAWMRRHINNYFKKTEQHGSLTVQEFEEAEKRVFKMVQQEAFVSCGDIIQNIHVTRDQEDIIRVQTRLLNRHDTLNFRQPILLPNNHPLVDQLIREMHWRNGHGGAQFLMSLIREKVWIIQGRRAIKRVINQCHVCKRFSARSRQAALSQLPQDRIKNAKIFEVVGIDLAGPLFLKNGEKTWIVLFTCAVYRAVHLELAESLSTDAFLYTLSRFISRRGRPTVIYSDNGTNFVGAANIFKELNWKRIERETQLTQIQWKFNPPSAAWWGGFWERLIRSVKDLLKRMLGNKKLNREQLATCLTEVEAVINSRPLTFVTEDDKDLIPLTPAMFLQEVQITRCPEAEPLSAEGLRAKYRDLTQLRKELRNRFRKEYLSQLVQRGSEAKVVEYKVGDIVLVGDDNQKRLNWPMARIMEIFPGKDGKVRVVRVKTQHGTLLRPVQRLYPMEILSSGELPPTPEEIKEAVRAKDMQKQRVTVVTDGDMSVDVMRSRSGRVVRTPIRFKQ